MIQYSIAGIITAAAIIYAIYKLVLFIKKPEENFACSPEKCKTCSMKSSSCAEDKDSADIQRPS